MRREALFDADVIIIGSGLAGGTLAGLLARHGIQCLLIEERPPRDISNRVDPRTLAINRATRHILLATRAWNNLPQDQIGFFRRMYVWDENGDGDIEFDSAELCEPALGYIVAQTLLEQAVHQANQECPEIRCLQLATLATLKFEDQAVCITLEDKTCLRAKLVIGADGARSRLRRLAGIDFPVHEYHQKAVACSVVTERPHEAVARQRFLQEGPLAFLPMADPHACGIVWTTTPNHADGLLEMEEAEFNQALAAAFDFRLGAIQSSGQRAGFPLQHAQATQYCMPRLALIGDAAHVVHPLAGQGANLGFMDAAALSEVLSAAWLRRRDIGARAILRRYERWRKGENLLMLKILQGFKYLFENRRPAVRHLRNTGLDLMDMMAPVKRVIMRRASGLSGDLPLVARGEY